MTEICPGQGFNKVRLFYPGIQISSYCIFFFLLFLSKTGFVKIYNYLSCYDIWIYTLYWFKILSHLPLPYIVLIVRNNESAVINAKKKTASYLHNHNRRRLFIYLPWFSPPLPYFSPPPPFLSFVPNTLLSPTFLLCLLKAELSLFFPPPHLPFPYH